MDKNKEIKFLLQPHRSLKYVATFEGEKNHWYFSNNLYLTNINLLDIRCAVRNLDAIISSGGKKFALIGNLHCCENLPGVKLLFSSIMIETLKNKNEGQ